jgi:predicted DNA-binding transcriptional regulator AlpA
MMNPEPEDQFVGLEYALAKFGVSRRTLYRRIAERKFPQPEKVGHLSKFRKSVIDRLFDNWGQPGGCHTF